MSEHDATQEPTHEESEQENRNRLEIEITFTTFLFSLAQTALTYLGELEHPDTGTRAVDLDIAKQNIDILGLLEQKTRNNLLPEEDKLLKNMLYDLRMKYLRARGGLS
ncbi:MAG: hypothetical protein A2284_05135 [Deltaproteobacteria bacterium RIFOXYA12_FULL_61_11]|nr:MAG: hypothetical protein A2284_05135 [Deltaproteobacteria bacterium RIFOXYA12_FULL_61_11]